MIEFTLLGVPVRVTPIHWLGLVFIGGVLGVNNINDIMPVLVFAIAGFIAILVHEMSHALVGRKYGGGAAAVTLVFLGGYTQYFNSQFTKTGRVLSTAAGPASTFALGIIAALVFAVFFDDRVDALQATVNSIFFPYWPFIIDSYLFTKGEQMFVYFVSCFAFISVWWTVLNLLPILPLDGGQILAEYLRYPSTIYKVGLVTSVLILILGVYLQMDLVIIFMIFMGYQNFKLMRQYS